MLVRALVAPPALLRPACIVRAPAALQLEGAVDLVEDGGRGDADDGHDEHGAGDARRLRIELLLLAPRRARQHAQPRHEQDAGEDRADERALDEACAALDERNRVEDQLDDRAKRRVDHGAHADAALRADRRDGHTDKVGERQDAAQRHHENGRVARDPSERTRQHAALALQAAQHKEVEDREQHDRQRVDKQDVDAADRVLPIFFADRAVVTQQDDAAALARALFAVLRLEPRRGLAGAQRVGHRLVDLLVVVGAAHAHHRRVDLERRAEVQRERLHRQVLQQHPQEARHGDRQHQEPTQQARRAEQRDQDQNVRQRVHHNAAPPLRHANVAALVVVHVVVHAALGADALLLGSRHVVLLDVVLAARHRVVLRLGRHTGEQQRALVCLVERAQRLVAVVVLDVVLVDVAEMAGAVAFAALVRALQLDVVAKRPHDVRRQAVQHA